MFDWQIVCLMVRNISLTATARSFLLSTAKRMAPAGETRRLIKCEEFEGLVTTDGASARLGSFGGTAFKAEIETNRGKGLIHFIVDLDVEYDPKDSVWMSRRPGQADNAAFN